MKLTLHKLEGWNYVASIDDGAKFELGYYDVTDYMAENNITELENKAGE